MGVPLYFGAGPFPTGEGEVQGLRVKPEIAFMSYSYDDFSGGTTTNARLQPNFATNTRSTTSTTTYSGRTTNTSTITSTTSKKDVSTTNT